MADQRIAARPWGCALLAATLLAITPALAQDKPAAGEQSDTEQAPKPKRKDRVYPKDLQGPRI
jgi:hypothetical protein